MILIKSYLCLKYLCKGELNYKFVCENQLQILASSSHKFRVGAVRSAGSTWHHLYTIIVFT